MTESIEEYVDEAEAARSVGWTTGYIANVPQHSKTHILCRDGRLFRTLCGLTPNIRWNVQSSGDYRCSRCFPLLRKEAADRTRSRE